MANEIVNFVTGRGRLVAGSVSFKKTTDFDGKPLVKKNGEPRAEWSFAVAFQKGTPDCDAVMTALRQAATSAWPKHVNSPSFSWKYIDGDSTVPNKRGNVPSDREGFPGHMVVWFTSGSEPECHELVNGKMKQIRAEDIKTGYYVRVQGNAVGNAPTSQTPGIYVNHKSVLLVERGEEIANNAGPSAAEAFGYELDDSSPARVFGTAPAPTPAPAPAAPPPAPDFLAGPRYRVNGNEYTREQLLASGWSPAQIDQIVPF